MASSSSQWVRRASGRAEMAVLLDFARGSKTYEDVTADAQRYVFEAPVLGNLMGQNTPRTIQKRLEALTGICTYSLTCFNIRKKGTCEDEPLQAKRHPFNLMHSTIKQRLTTYPHYIMAFGLSHHRAWVVGQRALECSLGYRAKCFGGLVETILMRPGSCLGASWGLFWASRGPLSGLLGISWGLLGASRRPLGGFLGPPGGFLRPRSRDVLSGCLGGRRGALLGRAGAAFGASWAVLGRSWGPLGPPWSVGDMKRREPIRNLQELI
eukprot:9498613-Pyramimonas_sp.AAC.4